MSKRRDVWGRPNPAESEKIRFEVQIEAPRSRNGWLAVGGREGYINLCNEDRVKTLTYTVEKAREAIELLKSDLVTHGYKIPNYRIVKVTVVTTYDVVE